ncbi:unnamed protein product [Auanema sp. JU1783]|nr:unnamed protein product [Auanema sp. JU1783]
MCEIKDASTSFEIVHTTAGCLEIVANCEGYNQIGFNFGGQEWGFLTWTENLFQLRDIRLICNDNGDWVIIIGESAATPVENLICLNFLG